MANRVYSIVLNDDVVEAIDNTAYRLGMTRSALINHILAQSVSLVTPEQRRRNIISAIRREIDRDRLFVMLDAGDNILTVKSQFKYKYNPTIKYSIVFTGKEGKGEIRIAMRTQNSTLIEGLDSFLHLWSGLEEKYPLPFKEGYFIAPGRYTRFFTLAKENVNEEEIGDLLWQYINTFDTVMKDYFKNGSIENAEKMYLKLLK
ncbi:MAG TPA: hypothetical protein DCG28_05255 [Lachnospiraceae bacterium]|nr:hypothetical protein [Lachnospiraceae bacterium]